MLPRRDATGLRAGKAAREGAPSQKTHRLAGIRTPRGREDSVIRRILAVVVTALVVVPSAAAVRVHVRDRRQDEDALRHDGAERERATPTRSTRSRRRRPPASSTTTSSHVVRPVRRPDRPLRRRRPDRLGVQGEREVAAGRRRRGEAQGRRHRALVLGAVRRRGGAEDARPRAGRDAEELLPRLRGGRQRHAHGRRRRRAARRRTSHRSDTGRDAGARSAASARTRGLVRATLAGAVRSNALA